MKVQILVIEGCPHAIAARAAVAQVLADVGRALEIEEVTVRVPGTPGFAGSPTVLVDGRDVDEGAQACSGVGCRIYANPANRGVPPPEAIRRAIAEALQREGQS